MTIKIIKEKIILDELKKIAEENFGDMIKGAVDVEKKVVALGGEMHIDANEELIKTGSEQQNIWGFNIHINRPREDWLEFNSLINIKPAVGNRSMNIENETIRKKIKGIFNELIK